MFVENRECLFLEVAEMAVVSEFCDVCQADGELFSHFPPEDRFIFYFHRIEEP